MTERAITLAASAVIRNADGDYLLIRRATPPQKGHCTLPGGRVDAGETLQQTAIREVDEETGLVIRIISELGQLQVPDGKGGLYEIHDFLAERLGGEVIAGDDAADVGWFSA